MVGRFWPVVAHCWVQWAAVERLPHGWVFICWFLLFCLFVFVCFLFVCLLACVRGIGHE